MREIELALEGFVRADAFAEEFCDAEDGGEWIVQFVGDAGEHLAHGGELFGLDELLLEALEVGDVAAGEDHAFDVAGFTGERAEIEKNAAPIALFMTNANFERGEHLPSGNDIVVKRSDGGHLLGMGAIAKIHHSDFLRFVAENLARARADESVVGVGVQHEDEVRKIVDETTGKLLLLAEAALDFAALGDIHDGALVTDDLASIVANGSGGVQAHDGSAVLAKESDFAALDHRLGLGFLHQRFAFRGVNENLGDLPFEQVLF